jgi:hypothetical protein
MILLIVLLLFPRTIIPSVHQERVEVSDLCHEIDSYSKKNLKEIISNGGQLVRVCSLDKQSDNHFQWYEAQAFLKNNYGQSTTRYLQQAYLNNGYYDEQNRLMVSYARYALADGTLCKQSELIRGKDIIKYSSPLLTGGLFTTVILGFLSAIRFY